MIENLTKRKVAGRTVRLRLGVDLGGNDIKLGATDLDAETILTPELVKRPSLTAEGPDRTASQVLDGAKAVLQQLGAKWEDVADIAVTVPCPCTPDGVILQSMNLGTPETAELWTAPFGDFVAAAVKASAGVEIPVFACNDANAAAQDDDFARFGLDASPRTSVFITSGTGLGGCVLINGSVHYGKGQAGELGHLKVAIPPQHAERFTDDPAPRCGCGAVQCAEARASLTALRRRVVWATSERGAALIRRDLESRGETYDEATMRTLRELASADAKRAAYEVRNFADQHDDAIGKWLLEEWAIVYGLLFASIAPVLHPDRFIIGGGLTEMSPKARDWFIDVARRAYGEANQQVSFDTEPGNCEIVWSVSRDQGWRGAILMAIRRSNTVARDTTRSEGKHEVRISKFETNPRYE